MTRIEKIRKKMEKKGIDALIVLDSLNQQYLSGFAFTDGLLLITKSRAFLITDFRYYEMAKNDAYSDFEVIIPENRKEKITKLLKEDECKVIGFEDGSISYSEYQRNVESYPFCKFEGIGNMLEELREIKDAEEIALMQKAQDITDKAYSELINRLTPNMTEIEVAAELEYLMRRAGASGFAFETIAVSGDASALPHGTPRNVKLRKGFLTMDFGAKYNGYCSDMTRTVVIGTANAEIKKLYNTVIDAQNAALAYIKAGMDCADCDKAARDVIDANPEYKGTFGHSLGHGVGLFIHESPRLAPKTRGRILRVGEIVTIEPGSYLYAKYGCRIGDMAAVKEDGVYNFTHSTKDLIEIL